MTGHHRDDALSLGDHVVTEDSLAEGDIVYFDRVAPDRVIVRPLTQEVLAGYSGRIFAVIAGSAPGQVQFRDVSRDEVE